MFADIAKNIQECLMENATRHYIKTRQQMLLEYEQLSKPDAQTFNQTQSDNESEYIPNYLGGRS